MTKVLGTLLTLGFTSVLAPVLVHHLNEAQAHKAEPPAADAAEERVVMQGLGATPEEAWYDAQGKALRTVAATMVDARTWAQDGVFICTTVLRDGKLITRCEDLTCTPDRGFWRRDVAVFVARAELAQRLKAARVRVVASR